MKCKRCGTEHHANLVGTEKPSDFCGICQVRNVFDGLGMVTPPEMLDKYTKNPTLTKEEFLKALQPKKRKRKQAK